MTGNKLHGCYAYYVTTKQVNIDKKACWRENLYCPFQPTSGYHQYHIAVKDLSKLVSVVDFP